MYLGESVSDLTLVDFTPEGRILGRRQLLSGTRYLYPSLSPDGSRLAVVSMDRGSRSRLDILDVENTDTNSAAVIASLDLGSGSAAYPSWAPDGRHLVFTVRNDGGRRIAVWNLTGTAPDYLTARSMESVKRPVYHPDGTGLFYTSNRGGSENLWLLPGGSEPALIAASRPFGIEQPVPAADGKSLLILEYDSRAGRQVTRIDLPDPTPTESAAAVAGAGTSGAVVADSTEGSEKAGDLSYGSPSGSLRWPERDPLVRESMIREGRSAFPESRYSPAANGLNFHSWGILPSGPLLTATGLKLFVESADVLGTSHLEFGGTWDLIESSPGAYLSYTYTGIRPVLGLDFSYRYRLPQTDRYHQILIRGSASYPANLSRNGIWQHYLTPGIEGGYYWFLPAADSALSAPQEFPVLSYRLAWSRLRQGSYRAIYPDLGWSAVGRFAHIPGSAGDSAAGSIRLYLPGGPRNTSLRLGTGLERRTFGFAPLIDTARGYDWLNPPTVLKATIDYELPLAYPDWPIGSVVFIQRFRLGLYSDFAFLGSQDALTNRGPWLNQWSSGAALTLDFSAFNQLDGLSLGFRFNWLWQENRATFNLMVMDIALF